MKEEEDKEKVDTEAVNSGESITKKWGKQSNKKGTTSFNEPLVSQGMESITSPP